MCREEIKYDIENLSSTPIPVHDKHIVELSDDIVQIQQKMAQLFERQKAKGGIIDVEAEKNKYYLTLVCLFICLRHFVNGDFCGHSSFVLWHQNLTTFDSWTLAKSESCGGGGGGGR